jgi:hypothetical protein
MRLFKTLIPTIAAVVAQGFGYAETTIDPNSFPANAILRRGVVVVGGGGSAGVSNRSIIQCFSC